MQPYYFVMSQRVIAIVLVLCLAVWGFFNQSSPTHQIERGSLETTNSRQWKNTILSSPAREITQSNSSANLLMLDVKTSQYETGLPGEAEDQSRVSIYSHSFDRGFENWEGNKSIWQIGAPVDGPNNLCADDSMCVGTVLDGHYPDFENAKLSSPPINLPNLRMDETISFQLSNWFDIDTHDRVEISVLYEIQNDVWTDAKVLLVQSGKSLGWQKLDLDLSSFAGKKARLQFELIQSKERKGTGSGWYIDDLQIKKTSQTQS